MYDRKYARKWRETNPEKFKAQKLRSYNNMRKNSPAKVLIHLARKRVKKNGLPCTITVDDIVIPTHCPILGIELCTTNKGLHADNSPSIDRIIPSLGYIPGNVIVISWRANRIKCDATPEELKLIYEYYAARAGLVTSQALA